MIPREVIEHIYNTARIEEVVGDYVSLKKRGANLIGLCPFHDEKTGSFTVSPSKGIYKCFGCGAAGNAINFVMQINKCSYTEALRQVAKRYHIEVPEREMTPEQMQLQDDRESMFVLNEWACSWFERQLWDTDEGRAIGLSYLHQRGMTDEMIRKFHIGYSPDKSLLSLEAVKTGYREQYLLNDSDNPPYVGTGLCLRSSDGKLYDRFHSRVIFPFYSPSGKVTGFAGRLMKKSDKVGKYVNSPTSLLFEKHNTLYGLEQAKHEVSKLDRCYLVEGQIDVISLHQAGIINVMASGGTSLTMPQIKLIHRYTSNITILYDGDKAGIKAALRGIDMILEEGINVKVVLLPEGEDPDSYAQTHNASEVLDYIAQQETDFIRFKTQLLSEETGDDPISRSTMIRSIVTSISVIPDAIVRQVYIKSCSQMLEMEESMLSREVAKLRNEKVDVSTRREVEPPIKVPDAAQPVAKNYDSSFDSNMRNLLQLVVRYGDKVLYLDYGVDVQVGQFILRTLREENISPRQEVHQRIIDEYEAHYQDPGFVAERFFTFHPEEAVNRLAVELITDRYRLSRIFSKKSISENVVQHIKEQTDEDILPELTTRLLLEIKYTVLLERIANVQQQLEQAQREGDWDKQCDLMAQMPNLMQVRKEICKLLGDRVITR